MSSDSFASASASASAGTLYIYDHCPYCTRVRILTGLKSIPITIRYLANHDEESHKKLCGSKQVPILQKPDSSILLESLDIVKYFDSLPSYSPAPLLTPHSPSKKALADYNPSAGVLYWRYLALGLPEFKDKESIEYFQKKKEATAGSFEEHKQKNDQLKKVEEDALAALDQLIPTAKFIQDNPTKGGLGEGGAWSYDDIFFFARLRSLTAVKNFQWYITLVHLQPPNARAYVDNLAKQAKIDLYDDRAL